MRSLWEKEATAPQFTPLEGHKTTDVLIVGGGLAGLLCAYELKNAGVDCLLVEADQICGGITRNTTAKITLAHGLLYDKLIHRLGEEKAKLYLQAQTQAMQKYAHLCQNIDCDYEVKDSYVYSLKDRALIRKEVAALIRLGGKAFLSEAPQLPFSVAGAVCVKEQAQFHPLKFLYAIAEELPIHEHTKVINWKPQKAITDHGEITYNQLIVATHFPILNKHGGYFLKLYQHRSYVLALKAATPPQGMYVDASDTGLSFRTHGNLLLLGGGGHRTGKQGGCWQELEAFAQAHYPKAQIVDRWATQDCITLDRIPYIGPYSKSIRNTFVATGFNKWGVTNAMVAAGILCDQVQGKANPFASVFSPSRSILHPQAAVNALESTLGLLTPTLPRCPHLGCALKYNRAEHTWDCPCHGSRFTKDGQLIDNPATDDKKL